MHIDNKGKDILILSKGPVQALHGTTLTAEAQCSINFSKSNRKFCLSLNFNGATVFYLLMLQENINSKEKIFK